MAIEEVNAAGGIQGHPIKLVLENDEFEVAKSLAAANKIIASDKPHILTGPYYSSSIQAVQKLTEEQKIPHVVNCGSARKLSMEGQKMFFRLTLSDLWQTEAMVKYAVDTVGAKRIAIIAESGSHGAGTLEGWVQDLDKLYKMKPVAIERFENEDMDFTAQLSKARAANADALVLVPTGSPTAARLVQQARRMGFTKTPVFHSSSISGSMDYIKLGGAAVEGAISPCAFLETNPDPKVQEFVKRFHAKYGQNPEGKEPAQGYDMIQIFKLALEQKDSSGKYKYELGFKPETLAQDRAKIVEALGTVKKYQGYCGIEVNFGPSATPQDRDGIKEPIIAKVEGGKWVPIKKITVK
jgi:branched-chain amino acid transport system substrate-binding protein